MLEELDLKSDRSKATVTDIRRKPVELEVIDVKNLKLPEKDRAANVVSIHRASPCAQSSSQPTIQSLMITVEALYNQVQSLHDTTTVLERRLTVIEEALRALL